jgi:acyl-coenzyme A thioesterase PaaI-like protein
LALILLVFVALLSCSDDNPVDGDGIPCCGVDTSASAALGNLAQAMSELGDMTLEEIRNLNFDDEETAFEQLLLTNANNAGAHLGLALIELLELNYDEDIWELIDSLNTWAGGFGGPILLEGEIDRHHTLVGRQFTLLVQVPYTITHRMVTDFPPNVTVNTIQDIIEQKAMPALGRALGHLALAEENAGTAIRLRVDFDGGYEYVLIDRGEIYVLDASLRALRAAFGCAIAYDVDMFGTDGTYDWIDTARKISETDIVPGCATYELRDVNSHQDLHLYLNGGLKQALVDSILVAVLHHNIENRDGFLTLRGGGTPMRNAGLDLVGTVGKLEASVNFIRNIRPDNHNPDHLLKLTDLTDLDSELRGPNNPNFAQNINTVEDVLAFVRNFVSGPMTFTEELGPQNQEYTWTMNVSRLFNPAVSDWKDLLPLYEWHLPQGNWVELDRFMDWSWDAGGGSTWQRVYHDGVCQNVQFQNIGTVHTHYRSYDLITMSDILWLVNPVGEAIDPNVTLPYFPDYTFNGLFPGMNRSDWEELINILD